MRFWKYGLLATLMMALVSCGGGGGGSATSSSTSYAAGISVGDSGSLTIDTTALTYSLAIENSSYGLGGQTLTGNLRANADGTYSITGTTYGKLFVYPNYAVLPVKIDPSDAKFADYFAKHPYITKSFYVPVFALKKSSLLSTTDDVTSNGVSMEYRAGTIYQSTVSNTTSYKALMSRGAVTKVSNTEFTVRSCNNGGRSSLNSRLATANCTDLIATTRTFTYDTASNAWLVTPPDTAQPNQVIRAYFVKDSITNQVVGYIDTADATKNSAGFSVVAIAPANTVIPHSSAASYSFTGYQLCLSDANCAATGSGSQQEFGVFAADSLPMSNTSQTVTSSGGCTSTETDDSPANGFFQGVWTGTNNNSECTSSGSRPDTAGFFIGGYSVNGKGRSLMVLVGYDTTVVAPTPSQKLTIGNIAEN